MLQLGESRNQNIDGDLAENANPMAGVANNELTCDE